MNRYPLWKNLLIIASLVLAVIYALPNLYGEEPAIQVSPIRTNPIDRATAERIDEALKRAQIPHRDPELDKTSIKVRFDDTETQIRARDVVQNALGRDNYVVALNLLPATPKILSALGAKPMTLGLDLRGGVHFLMQVDTRAILKKAYESTTEDVRRVLRDNKVRYTAVNRGEGGVVDVVFRDAKIRDEARDLVRKELPDLELNTIERGSEYVLAARLSDKALAERKRVAVEQNITTLRNRVNELGVVEPVIQQQGEDRIVVQLPGVQDTAEAKRLMGRTATLEILLVDEDNAGMAMSGQVPVGDKLYRFRDGRPILLKNRLVYSGDNIESAQDGFDNQTGQAIVTITLDARGAGINKRVSGENVGKRMAVVFVEIKSDPQLDANGRPILDENGREVRVSRRVEEVITAPVIKTQLGQRFQIEGLESGKEAKELSLLLNAGALAAPMEIIEERTVGPSLGAENIQRGFHSTWVGFAAIAVFMIGYYMVFGAISVLALAANVLLLIGILSILPTTLTLPGMAGIALTIGMAIDANVLINERIREELRNGNSPQASIYAGYERAFGTILDSNVTTLIAGIGLLIVPGSVRGFAVVLCLGILTSMYSGVVISRALVNLLYGRRVKLRSLPIGNTGWESRGVVQAPHSGRGG